MATRENLPPQVITRVMREIRELVQSPPLGVSYVPCDDDVVTEIHAQIEGPEETPYYGGSFRLKLVLSEDFPASPPRGFFLTRIYHPNVASNGDICVNTLKRDWNADVTLSHVLQVIRCLLIVPFPESSLNDEAGKLFMESYDEYARRARLMTQVHAMAGRAPGAAVAAEESSESKDSADGASAASGAKKVVSKQKDVKKKAIRRL